MKNDPDKTPTREFDADEIEQVVGNGRSTWGILQALADDTMAMREMLKRECKEARKFRDEIRHRLNEIEDVVFDDE